jgi:hypothetical protein
MPDAVWACKCAGKQCIAVCEPARSFSLVGLLCWTVNPSLVASVDDWLDGATKKVHSLSHRKIGGDGLCHHNLTHQTLPVTSTLSRSK